MVVSEIHSKKRNSVEGLLGELRGLKYALSSYSEIKSGLYTYPIIQSNGSRKRLHLRISKEGNGILFVDVTDVIHLHGVGTEIIKMALDGLNQGDAAAILRSKYRVKKSELIGDVKKAYHIIDHLTQDMDGCQTCALSGLLDRAPLFSLNTNAPYKVDVALTYGCNNQCPHCYNEANRLAMPSLPISHWFRVFDKIVELGIPHVILTGGEATLHPDFLKIVEYADQLGLVVGLNSNGRYLSHAPFMEKAAKAGLNHVQITLGSCFKDVHNQMMGADSFDQTIQGIRTAISTGVHVITNTTLMRSNLGQIEQLIEFLYDLGIRTFAMNGMIYAGGGFEHPNAILAEELPAIISKVRTLADDYGMRFLWYTPTEYCRMSPMELDVGTKKCNAGEYSICIEPNGDVLPCQSYYVSAGNILNDPWDSIWNNNLFISFRDREEYPEEYELPQKCWNCPDLFVCGAGCRIEREAEDGVRIAEIAGGGCAGCSGYINTDDLGERDDRFTHYGQILDGFVPFPSQVSIKRRSSGQMDIITNDEIISVPPDDR
jgi:radical SAM protein with 4Fe4S-binding SPASM domain